MKKFYRFFFLAGMALVAFSSLVSSAHAVTADEAYHAGVTFFKQDQFDQSISQLKAAIVLDPNHWRAYQLIGYIYYKENNTQEALDFCNKSLQIHPNNPKLQKIVDRLNAASSLTQENNKIKNSFYFNIGGAVPVTPNGFVENWSKGGNLGIGYGIGVSKIFSIVVDATGSYFPVNQTNANYPSYITFQGGIGNLTFLANAKIKFIGEDSPVIPYLIAGFGPSVYLVNTITATNANTGISETIPSKSETDFAFRLGLGIDIRLDSGIALFIETNGLATSSSQYLANNETVGFGLGKIGMKFDL